MTLYRVFPDPRLAIDPATNEGSTLLRELYHLDDGPSLRVNMIVRPDGAIAGADGTSGSLTSTDDRQVLRHLRTMADVVVIGAQTLRHERIPVPRNIPLLVVSASGHIAAHNIVWGPESGDLIVLTPSPDTVSATLGDTPHRTFNPGHSSPTARNIIDFCWSHGWEKILVEGGQRMATLFAEAGLVDDLCLTLTGAPLNDDTPPVSWWPGGTTWTTSHLLMDDHRMLYHRYIKQPSTR